MKLPKVSFVSVLALFILLAFSFTTPAFGQAKPDAGSVKSTLKQSPAVQEQDRKAMKKLKEMTPEEAEALDDKLAEALTYFYDGEYARALPLFKEISENLKNLTENLKQHPSDLLFSKPPPPSETVK